MKYIILIYSREGVWEPEEHSVALEESIQICHDLAAKGKYLHASPLQPASTAMQVRVREGKATVVDGPYAETTEILAGYFLIDVENMQEAIEVAKRIPGTTRGIAEVRPLVELTTLPQAAIADPRGGGK